jgi:dienelactone hydrolase
LSARGLTAAQWGERLARAVKVVKPSGKGPFPVVLQFHGCGGVQPLQDHYARAATDAGVAAVIVDSFKPRGMSRLEGHLFVCTGAILRGSQRAADVHAMLRWLETQGWADRKRIAAAGWSHGAWTLMDAFAHGANASRVTGLADADPRTLERLKGLFLVYPYASYPSLTSSRGWGKARPKVHAILGGKDMVVGVRGPQRALARLRADGVPVETVMLPDATHSFDDDAAMDPRTRYRPDLSAQAREHYAAALKAAFA